MKLVECVPNFSEGRDKAKVDALAEAARSLAGVQVLDVEMDADHHRSVLTFVAPPELAVEAAFRCAAKARELIDLTAHQGEHPRMGAVDVIPFVPVCGTSLADCVRLAEALGERIGRELEIPVYLYDRAARRPERRDLAQVRKGQFEGLRAELGVKAERDPDFGPRRVHPTAGAVAVGAREQIVNFNVNLEGVSLETAKAIARGVRSSGGGLAALRAKEIDLAAQGLVQISTVLTDHATTSLAAVEAAIEEKARAAGGRVAGTELVGLVPRSALTGYALERLRAGAFKPAEQILEDRLEAWSLGWQASASRLCSALAGVEPTPGGGSAAAIAAAMGCALAQMAVSLSARSPKTEPGARALLEKAQAAFEAYRGELELLAAEDAAAFEGFMSAFSLPKSDPERPAKMQAALGRAAEVPLETARKALAAWRKSKEAAFWTTGSVSSDIRCAAHLLRAAVLCALENVQVNAVSLKDAAAAKRLKDESETIDRALEE